MLLKINRISFPGLGIEEITIDSNAITLFGGKLKIAWYGIIMMCGMIFAFWYVWRRFKENSIPSDDLIDLAFFTVLSGVVGARIYYVLFKIDYYIVTSGTFFQNIWDSFVRIISVWNGGLAIYGSLLGGGLAAALIAKKKKINFMQLFDFLAPSVMMAQAIGRWGNFCNAEAYGAPTSLPWKMGIWQGNGWNYYHPTFLYESLWNFIGFFIIHFIFVKNKKFNGEVFYIYMMWYGFGRMIIEGLRMDSLYLGPIRISQLVGALSLIVGTVLLVYNFVKLRKAREINGTDN